MSVSCSSSPLLIVFVSCPYLFVLYLSTWLCLYLCWPSAHLFAPYFLPYHALVFNILSILILLIFFPALCVLSFLFILYSFILFLTYFVPNFVVPECSVFPTVIEFILYLGLALAVLTCFDSAPAIRLSEFSAPLPVADLGPDLPL